ncbi:MAG TPA: efflux RND transporter periplasmic adaptor subunit [Pirellulales bacterium]|jgi:multidrug resistance efflux pump|nr:efflux RND transporter periplasmic adaptor subunit [Pirellulales bacterium]
MIAFLTILYVAAIILVFRVWKVPPRPSPIAAFVVLGILGIGGVAICWTLAAPISTRGVVVRYVVQVAPLVKGRIISIPAKPNVPLKGGRDILFEIDSAPYQYSLKLAQSQLNSAQANLEELKSAIKVANASIGKSKADVDTTKFAYEANVKLQAGTPGAVSQLKVSQDEAKYLNAKAALEQSNAELDKANKTLLAAQETIPGLEAQIETAKFNLAQCTVYAPADGFVTDWQIRVGSLVSPVALAAVGTFIETEETMIAAAFPAQQLVHVQPGAPVELAFKSQPGVLFHGEVERVLQATGEGQDAPSGKLPSAAQIGSPGYLAVKIHLNPDEPAGELEMGAPCTVAIYTDWGKPFGMISKVTIRMAKWLYFLPIPGI